MFVSHQKIKALNKKYLNRNYATDVLAFDLNDNTPSGRKSKVVIGDIIVSTDAALKYASGHQIVLAKELILYVIHGLLHLCGYDDREPGDARRMRRKEQKILSYLGTKVNTVARKKVVTC